MATKVANPKYIMPISRLTVDKLGVKLYDRASAVLAELVANSYDADATEVVITAPTGQLLASKVAGVLQDHGYVIEVRDDGRGMTPTEVNEFYLPVGTERRKDPKRGDTSLLLGRKVMGNKGVGKLAPFGICERIEILTSGGKLTDGFDENGEPARGYLTAHLTLDRSKIVADTDEPYEPDIGELDGIVRLERGTILKLSNFAHRHVPTIKDPQPSTLTTLRHRVGNLEDCPCGLVHRRDRETAEGSRNLRCSDHARNDDSLRRRCCEERRWSNPNGHRIRFLLRGPFLSCVGLDRLRSTTLQGRPDGWREDLLSRKDCCADAVSSTAKQASRVSTTFAPTWSESYTLIGSTKTKT